MSPESLKILYRLITCFQSSGRIGKSLVFEIILAWARFAGIPIAAVDCDAEHKTLSKRFPEAAFVDATRSNDEFLRLIMESVSYTHLRTQSTARHTGVRPKRQISKKWCGMRSTHQ